MAYGPYDKYPGEIKALPVVDYSLALPDTDLQTSEWTSSSTDLTFDATSSDIEHKLTQCHVAGGLAGTIYTIENRTFWSNGEIRIVQITVNVLVDAVP